MDQRLIATVPVVVYLVVGSLFVLALSLAHAPLSRDQSTVLVVGGVVAPVISLGLVWARNYVYGPPLLVGGMVLTAGFATSDLLIRDTPANALEATGDGATALAASTVALVLTATGAAVVGCWLWYRERPGFRSAVDRVLRPPSGGE